MAMKLLDIVCRCCRRVTSWLPVRGILPAVTKADLVDASLKADGINRRGTLRQVAILLAYQGNNYYGMEFLGRHSRLPSVESELFRALRLTGAVQTAEGRWPPRYSRSSRTDRGVSALGQVVSVRMRLWDGAVDDINDCLPADIRVCDVRRVPPRFNAQLLCDDRLYSYTVPTFAFTPMEQTVKEDYRIPPDRHREVAELFRQYGGTHSFHSFSPGGNPSSLQMTRHVRSVELGAPYMAEGIEFTTVWIKGMSFVLNQIRRMVGLVMAVCRGSAVPQSIPAAFSYQRIITPTAPGLGLILRQARFDTFATANWNVHGPLSWSDSAAQHIASQQAALLQHIHRTEAEQRVTLRFLSRLLYSRQGVVCTPHSRSPLGYAAAVAAAAETHSAPPSAPSAEAHSAPPSAGLRSVSAASLDGSCATEGSPLKDSCAVRGGVRSG